MGELPPPGGSSVYCICLPVCLSVCLRSSLPGKGIRVRRVPRYRVLWLVLWLCSSHSISGGEPICRVLLIKNLPTTASGEPEKVKHAKTPHLSSSSLNRTMMFAGLYSNSEFKSIDAEGKARVPVYYWVG